MKVMLQPGETLSPEDLKVELETLGLPFVLNTSANEVNILAADTTGMDAIVQAHISRTQAEQDINTKQREDADEVSHIFNGAGNRKITKAIELVNIDYFNLIIDQINILKNAASLPTIPNLTVAKVKTDVENKIKTL